MLMSSETEYKEQIQLPNFIPYQDFNKKQLAEAKEEKWSPEIKTGSNAELTGLGKLWNMLHPKSNISPWEKYSFYKKKDTLDKPLNN